MSTRCNVLIKEGRKKVYLYHHYDGYPSGVGTMLKEQISKEWGNKWCCWYAYDFANYLVKRGIKYIGKDWQTGEEKEMVDDGYELTSGVHGDIDYLYVIDCKHKTLKCYKCSEFDMATEEIIKDENLVEIPDEEENNE